MDDIIEQRAWSGGQGYVWNKMLLQDLGYSRKDVLFSHAVRCYHSEYPRTGYLRRNGELNCRAYDGLKAARFEEEMVEGGLKEFDPNLFVITYHPRMIFKVPAYYRQLREDLRKAFQFSDMGYRPAVLMGEGAAALYFPSLLDNGGLKSWRGHWFEGDYPFNSVHIERTDKKLFKKAHAPVKNYFARRRRGSTA